MVCKEPLSYCVGITEYCFLHQFHCNCIAGARSCLPLAKSIAACRLAARHESGLLPLHLRDSGVPGEALKRKLKEDISFALRRGTIALVTP
jgi:hypothetical protein